MKLYKSLMAAVALAMSAVTLTGCNEDEAVAPVDVPYSDWKANTTIADFKAEYWQSDDNYYKEIGTKANGDHIILGGRVAANDISGNIYQNIVLQDETAAVTIAVSMKDLNVKYKVGEEMFIDVTGLYAGKYSGLFEIGKDDMYNGTTPQIGKMSEEQFTTHTQLNGLPEPSKVNAVVMTIEELNAMKSDKESLIKYQSQLIRINGVSFKGGGTELWAERGTSHNTRYLFNEAGASIAVDNSGMSDFNDKVLPEGHGDVIAILSYFRSGWQLVFRSNDDCIDFGGESYAPETPEASGDGSAESPFSVGAVLDGSATGTDAWITGYIVGWIDGISMAEGATFSVPASSASNILLASKPDEKSVGNCIPVQLTGDVRNAVNLKDHPENLLKEISIRGSLERYFGSNGLKSPAAYCWGAQGGETPETPDTPTPSGTATFKKVTSVTSGKQYVFVIDNNVGTPIASNLTFGRLSMAEVSITNDEFTTSTDNAITITAVEGGYSLTDYLGRKLCMDDSHLSTFQINAAGDTWTITPENGLFRIGNVLNTNCYIVRSGTFTNIAPSDIEQYPTYDLPALYEKVN